MRVLVDARMLLGRLSGVARVVTQLVEHLAKRDDVVPIVLCGHERYAPWTGRGDVEMLVTNFTRSDRSPFRRLLWEETKLAGWVRQSNADVYHATWNSGVPSGLTIPTVLTIHDLIPWAKPAVGLRVRFHRRCYRLGVSRSCRRASVVTAVSDYSRGEIARTLGMDRRNILTIHNGVTTPKRKQAPAETTDTRVPDPFVLYVGGHEPRKNIAAVFRAMRAYWRTYDRNLTFALTGTMDALSPEARQEFDSLPPGSAVRFLGFPSDADLDSLYLRARALVLLSTDEGFGLPVLEAMAHGCPVIAANRASLPEVTGNVGILVEPDDTAKIAESIRRLATDRAFRSSMVARGLRRAGCFTWQHTCESMVRAYATARRKEQRTPSASLPGSVASQNPA